MAQEGLSLHCASFEGHDNVVRTLLDADAGVHGQGVFGSPYETALVGYFGDSQGEGCWGRTLKLLRGRGAKEPRDDYHYGIRCDGPCLSNGGAEGWIAGDRYKCNTCEVFNWCTACKSVAGARDKDDDENRRQRE